MTHHVVRHAQIFRCKFLKKVANITNCHWTKLERKLFFIRFAVLLVFALAGLFLGLYSKEVKELTCAVVGVKMCDVIGESLAEALATGAEDV